MFGQSRRRSNAAEESWRRHALVGFVLLVVAGLVVWMAVESPKGLPFQNEATVNVAFDDVDGLRSGADVRVGGVRVGRVSAIALADRQTVVTLVIPVAKMGRIYRGAMATVVNRSLLGQKFVEIQPGDPGSGVLPDGATIPASQTRDSTQLLTLLQIFDKPTRDATASSLQQLGVGAAGHAADLRDAVSGAPSILPDLGTVSVALSTNRGADLSSMLTSIRDLSSRFKGREQQIKELNDQFATTLDAVAVNNGGALRDTLNVAPDSMRELRAALVDVREPLRTTTAAMTGIRDGAASLGDATPDLRGVFREGLSPMGKTPRVADQAAPALGDLAAVSRDAQPFAPRFADGMNMAATPLSVLGPYSPEISAWFTHWNNALTSGDSAGHWLRFTVIPATDAVTGNVPGLRDPLTHSDAYPKPGEAPRQAAPQIPLLGNVNGGPR